MLNTIGEMYFRLHQNRWFSLGIVGLLLVCVLLISGARPAESEHLYDVSAFQSNSNISSLMGRYVQVSGKLDHNNGYQVKNDILGIQMRGTRFIPLTVAGQSEPMMVLEQDFPTADANGDMQITGLIRGRPDGADQYPAYYLEPGAPANITLNNLLAQVALSLAALSLLLILGGWLAKRMDYALDARETAGNYTGPLLWFGSLGSRFQNTTIRQQAVSSLVITKAIQLEPQADGQPWSVVMQRAISVKRTGIATVYGGLPALRLQFEDERGQLRNGVVAGDNVAITRFSEQLERQTIQ